MKKQGNYFSTLELLEKYSSQLNKMIKDGSFYCLPYTKRSTQIRQIKRLYNKLRGPVGDMKLISILAAASFLVLGVSCNLQTGGDGNKNTLEIAGYVFGDAAQEVKVVALGGNGGFEVPPTVEQVEAVLAFFDESVDAGTREGFGPGNSANGRLNALRNMIKSTRNLIEEELYEEAYVQLQDAYNRMDGDPKPPEFVTGEAVEDLRGMVGALLYGPVTPKVPSFAAPVQNPFGLTATYGYTFLAVADLDGDGDMERMAVAEMNEVLFWPTRRALLRCTPNSLIHTMGFTLPGPHTTQAALTYMG